MTKLHTQVFVSHSKPEASKITPILNERTWKPQGGMWTSTLDDEGGDWVKWLTGENYSLDDERWGGKLWLLEPTEANLAVIADPVDLRELSASYPSPEIERYKRLDVSLRMFNLLVDWEAVARDYDGLHVPNPWPWRFGGGSEFEMEASMFFYVMDAECTCWSRWCFDDKVRTLEFAQTLEGEA